jgi:NAD(P)H-hydrate epimerase
MRYFTREQAREFDRKAIEEYHIPSLILMENAGLGAAKIISHYYDDENIFIFCGHGNNGGDGLVTARHLYNVQYPKRNVHIFFLGDPTSTSNDFNVNFDIIKAMKIPFTVIHSAEELKPLREKNFLCVDAIFGTGLQETIKSPYLEMIKEMQSWWHVEKVALDIPSGLDATTGEVLGACLKVDTTITFGCAKQGFLRNSRPVGYIKIVDISIPRGII